MYIKNTSCIYYKVTLNKKRIHLYIACTEIYPHLLKHDNNDNTVSKADGYVQKEPVKCKRNAIAHFKIGQIRIQNVQRYIYSNRLFICRINKKS